MGCETKEDIKKLKQLKKELSKDPNNVDLLFKTGMLLFDPFIDMNAGLPYFEKAMLLDPSNPDLPFWAGYALYQNECAYEKSKKLFKRTLSIDSSRAEAYYMMFYVFWHINDDKKNGQKHLLKAIELQPNWFFPREQYIANLISYSEFDKAEKELTAAFSILDRCYKDRKIVGINTLEQYYIDNYSGDVYEKFKRSLDSKRKKLKEKKGFSSAALKIKV